MRSVQIGRRGWLVLAALAVAMPAVSAQQAGARPGVELADADAAFTRFQSAFGEELRADWNFETGHPRHIHGRPLDLGARPVTDAEHAALALDLIDVYSDLFGVDSSVLELRQVKRLNLQRIGTTDKVGVSFDQVVAGIPVEGASVSVLFNHDGTIISIDNKTLPGSQGLSVIPSLREDQALEAAAAAFGLPVVEVLGIELALVPNESRSAPALAWNVELRSDPGADGLPPQERISVDAHSGQVLRAQSTVHTFTDLLGNVQGMATPGDAPDSGSNPPLSMALENCPANGPSLVLTDVNGDFVIPFGGASPQNVTVDFGSNSTFIQVIDIAGAEISLTQSVTPGTPSSFLLNVGTTEQDTAEVNAFQHSVRFRNFVRSLDPADTTFDFQLVANVNIGSTCNAFYNGSSTNYFLAGGGCPNTAYTTVIAHEIAHWANDLYNSGNGSDGFGEGSSDVWAMFIYDTNIVGRDFLGVGNHIRDGLNTRQYCGSCGAGCYGEVHNDGEVLMGAFWKARENLNATHGDAAGDLIADTLMLSWYQVYDDSTICDLVLTHLLILDDDDGNLGNGTPNGCDLDAGFTAQGFPGQFTGLAVVHTPLAENQAPHSSLEIMASAPTSQCGGSVVGMTLYYSVDDGPFTSQAMLQTGGSGDDFVGIVPPLGSRAVVKYYLEVDNGTAIATEPRGAPEQDRHLFYVGNVTDLAFYDFEAIGDQGWTHIQIQTQDDWQRGAPQGAAGDPTAAYSGTNIWANDLGNPGWNGQYAANVHNVLTSPTFDFSGQTGVRVQFRRHLTVEEGIFDQATFVVDGSPVFSNPLNGHLLDDHWTLQEYDIGALADNDNSVLFQYDLQSDGGLQFGGWAIDDFRVLKLEDNPTDCANSSNYGAGTPGSGGITPLIYNTGGPASLGNSSFTIVGEQMLGGTLSFLIIGGAQANLPFGGATILVDFAGAILLPRVVSGSGAGTGRVEVNLPVGTDTSFVGLSAFAQFLVIDPGAAGGWSASRGLQFDVCNG